MDSQTIIKTPVHTEKQIDDVLFGKSDEDKNTLDEKIAYAKKYLSKIIAINGSKVYDVRINADNLEYNLQKKPSWITQDAIPLYYYPIEYAHITFTG